MDKPQFLVIGILAVAIGFFALRFTSEDPLDQDSSYGSRGYDVAMSGSDEGYGGGRYGNRDAAGGSSDRSSRFGSSGGERGERGERYAGGGTRRDGSATTAIGGSRSRRPGFGSSGLRSATSSGRAGASGIASTAHRERSSGAGSSSRADRVERLGAAEANVDDFYEEGAELPDNAILDLKNQDDVVEQDGQGDGITEGEEGWLDFSEDAQLTFPNGASGKAGTISLDIVPNWNGADVTDNSLLQIREPHKWENRIQMVKNGQFLRFIVTDSTGHEADISYKISHWEQGDTHRVTASWEDGVTTLWVDGKQVGSNNYPGPLHLKKTAPIHAGSDHASGAYGGLNGQAKIKLYSDARGPDDIT